MPHHPRRAGRSLGRPWAATLLAAACAAAVTLAQPAAAQNDDRESESPGDLTAEAVDRLLRALELLLGSIPQYEAPYVNEDGDIIIKRKHPEKEEELPTPEHKPAPPSGPDTTTT